MKYFIFIILLAFAFVLYSGVWINPVSEIWFGPYDAEIYGGIKVDISKQTDQKTSKAAGIYFEPTSRIWLLGSDLDTLENVNSVRNLSIDKKGGSVFINQNIEVLGNLNFISGNFLTGADTLLMQNSGSSVSNESESGMVIGNLKSKRYIGTATSTATGHFGGIGFSINNSGNDIGTVTLYRKTGEGSQVTIMESEGIKRQWKVETSIPFTGTRNVSAAWLGTEDNGNRLDHLKVWRYTGTWDSLATADFVTNTDPRTATFDINATASYTINNTDTYFAGGKGTYEEPYLIRTAQHLDSLRYYLGAEWDGCYFKQIANIDLGVAPWNSGSGWDPVGDDSLAFTSNYDGNGCSIYNLTINRPADDHIGLFGYITDSFIQNLKLSGISVVGRDYTGSLAGYFAYNSFANQCNFSGSVTGNSNVGGVTGGLNFYSSVQSSLSSCSVSGNYNIGGFSGKAENYSSITYSSSSGTISGGDNAGGLLGMNDNSDIYCSFSSGNADGSNYIGGLIGFDYDGNVSNCYSYGDVTGNNYLGGLTGYSYMTIISYCYSRGLVTGTDFLGGLTGYALYSSYNNCYWDIETSTQATSAGGEGKTTDDMTYPFDYNTFVGWDFIYTWAGNAVFNEGYPYLLWENRAFPGSPQNISVNIVSNNITISWDDVAGATEYKVYSSALPYGTFLPDLTGSFNGAEWTAPLSGTKKFYYIIAVNGAKIIKTESSRKDR